MSWGEWILFGHKCQDYIGNLLIFWKAGLEHGMCVRLIRWNLCNNECLLSLNTVTRKPLRALLSKAQDLLPVERVKLRAVAFNFFSVQVPLFISFCSFCKDNYLRNLNLTACQGPLRSLKLAGQPILWLKLYFVCSIRIKINKHDKRQGFAGDHGCIKAL